MSAQQVRLVPMTEEQYGEFIKVSMEDQVRNQIIAGTVDAGQAADILASQLGKMLPQGMATPGHHFFAIESAASGEHVGDFWFTTMKRGGGEVGFVMDIQIRPEHRRRGYGEAAFAAVERFAVEQGLDQITLSVFGHNTPARALYLKIGYREVGVSMAKKLGVG